ncbi:MAG: DUF4878 domain-containing protein [Fimbriimonadaceae bacterium]|nr:DUF4878 domain-containing protein [Fimbriimonadaceae bacterium]
MLRAGRLNIVLALGLASVIVLAVLLVMTRSSPSVTVGNFLTALAKADVDQLVELSHYDGDKAELRKQWEFCVKEAAPHVRFVWTMVGSREISDTSASVNILWTKDLGNQGYEKRYEIPCVKEDGQWKVDIVAVARDMFPALPR